MPVLPSAAWDHKPYDVHWHVRDQVTPITFTGLYYGDTQAEGFFGEIDDKTWIERAGGATYTYTELLESPNRVVLYDEARDRTVTIDWPEYDLTVSENGVETLYTVVDFSHRLTPVDFFV